MAGRTRLQQALPVTSGYKAAVWLSSIDRHIERIEQASPRVLVGEFSGAAGGLSGGIVDRVLRTAPSPR
jgi:3-carboxy-cis,cis-muconate cycloisomerase